MSEGLWGYTITWGSELVSVSSTATVCVGRRTEASSKRTLSGNLDVLMTQLLSELTRDAVQAAGPRYTPGLDDAAPNLRI